MDFHDFPMFPEKSGKLTVQSPKVCVGIRRTFTPQSRAGADHRHRVVGAEEVVVPRTDLPEHRERVYKAMFDTIESRRHLVTVYWVSKTRFDTI